MTLDTEQVSPETQAPVCPEVNRKTSTVMLATSPHRRSLLSSLATVSAFAAVASLCGCTSLGSSGPTYGSVRHVQDRDARVRVIETDDAVVRSVVAAQSSYTFAKVFGAPQERHGVIGEGAVLDITVWEAPPAVLFSNSTTSGIVPGAPTPSATSTFAGEVVNARGTINVPFVGTVLALGRTPEDVASEIAARLSTKAHDPQVAVRIADNQAEGVIVAGDVTTSRRFPLTTKNELLLDALTSAGGVRQPVDKVLIQITRGNVVAARPLGAIIRDPGENISLANNDVVTALYQPFSFQAMGAVGASSEVNFEGTGITLSQALGRVGGLQDNRANVKGVFVFRLENPQALPQNLRIGAPMTPEGKIPVVFRIDLSNPASFFVLQSFPMRDKDILYVSNAPLVDLQKFVSLVSQITFSVVGVANSIP